MTSREFRDVYDRRVAWFQKNDKYGEVLCFDKEWMSKYTMRPETAQRLGSWLMNYYSGQIIEEVLSEDAAT